MFVTLFYLQKLNNTPNLIKQEMILKEQSNQINKMYIKINFLYQSLFELEEFCESLIEEIYDDNRNQVMLFYKNRIIQSVENFKV